MNTVTIVLLVILVVLIGVLIALYFLGKRAQKRQAEQQAQIQATKQLISLMAIDKKRLPLKNSGLPQVAIDQTPRLMRRAKLPIVKAKVGPQIQILIADENVFELIPLKKEIKAEVSGLYIVGVKGIRGNLETPPPKKKGIFGRLRGRAQTAAATQTPPAKQKGNTKSTAKGKTPSSSSYAVNNAGKNRQNKNRQNNKNRQGSGSGGKKKKR